MHISEKYRDLIQKEIDRLQKHEGKPKIQPQDIAIIRILQDMLRDDQLPWEKSFISPSVNVISKKQYSGINRWILPGGEYITFNQLMAYNKSHKTHFVIPKVTDEDKGYTRFMKSPFPVIHYNVKPPRDATEVEIKRHEDGKKVFGLYLDDKTNTFKVQPPASKSYFRVYNTIYIFDSETGEQFPRLNIEKYITLFEGDKIIQEYQKLSGVKIFYDTPGRCFYTRREDAIHMSPLGTFKPTKKNLDPVVEYYSTSFHEMVHSTGTKERCDRDCFLAEGRFGSMDYSMEECVAELGSALLLSELNVDHDKINKTLDNSSSYISGWLDFLLFSDKNDKYGKGAEKIMYAIRRAEKARNYILSWFKEIGSDSSNKVNDN